MLALVPLVADGAYAAPERVAIQPESGLHFGRARWPADVGCVRRRVGVAGAAVRGGAMGARLRAGARGRR